MIDSIGGALVKCTPAAAYIQTVGITFEIIIPISTSQAIKDLETTLLYIHTQVLTNEPQVRLYGFATVEERTIFHLLTSVKGVGPGAAIKILSGSNGPAIAQALKEQDLSFFTGIKGIGKKTAERILFDLRNKADSPELLLNHESSNSLESEALEALLSLGYKKEEAKKAMDKCKKEEKFEKSEDLVRKALRAL